MTEAADEAMRDRLTRLERTMCWWRRMGTGVLAALCVGGPFVVVTMVGMQEARSVAAAQAPRLMAAMTAAFAAGQVIGPLAVSFLVGAVGGFDGTLLFASAVLVAGAALLFKAE